MIAGIVFGVVLYVVGIGLFSMNNKIGAGLIAVGSILLALCSYFYSKKICDDKASSVKKGLVSGIVIGVVFLVAGFAMPSPSSMLNSALNSSSLTNTNTNTNTNTLNIE